MTIIGHTGITSADCKSVDVQELEQNLVANSPFEGNWSLGNSNKGPVQFSVFSVSGVPYVSWNLIDDDGVVSGTTEVLLRFISRKRFAFSGYWGDVNLKVKNNCKLVGTQAAANNEQLKLFLYPAEVEKDRPAEPRSRFSSNEDFSTYLAGQNFEGQWKLNLSPEKSRFSFSRRPDGSLNSVYFHTNQGDGFVAMSAKKVEVLSPSRIRIELPEENAHNWDWVQLELQEDGSLAGIQTFDRNYVMLVDVAPK